jgi:hypothetical protein
MHNRKTRRLLKFLSVLGGGLMLNRLYLGYRNKVGYKPYEPETYPSEPW